MRLHEFGRGAITTIGDEPMTLEAWGALLDELMDQTTAQRKIFLLHERARALPSLTPSGMFSGAAPTRRSAYCR